MTNQQDTGVAPSSRSRAATATQPSQQAVSGKAGIPNAGARHPEYGPCDGFGPLWTCSQCLGMIQRSDGALVEHDGSEVDLTIAANQVGDFLLERAERAAVAAWGCCDSPAAIVDFMRASLILDFPGQPWRHHEDFERAVTAQGMEAATAAETRSGSVHDSPVRGADAPNLSEQGARHD